MTNRVQITAVGRAVSVVATATAAVGASAARAGTVTIELSRNAVERWLTGMDAMGPFSPALPPATASCTGVWLADDDGESHDVYALSVCQPNAETWLLTAYADGGDEIALAAFDVAAREDFRLRLFWTAGACS